MTLKETIKNRLEQVCREEGKEMAKEMQYRISKISWYYDYLDSLEEPPICHFYSSSNQLNVIYD